MSNNDKTTKGFTIKLERIPDKVKNVTSVAVCPKQMGEQIASLIESQLNAGEQINLKLSVENWDETYKKEEFLLEINSSAGSTASKDYTTNYWI